MIAFLRDFLPRPRRIPLGRPRGMTLITGASREKIDAIFDEHDRIKHLIVHTRLTSLNPGTPPTKLHRR
ncbi:MAG TPA: hypothetical protein PKE55_05580 [Kiritimatiellia bacterium]|mgnify:CR=1 FL=1|nr:hypothetical protein [Kiritimatiellia bacterium]